MSIPLPLPARTERRPQRRCCALVLMAADTDPTILVGGELPQIGGNLPHQARKDYLPLEACEYVESFLHFKPYMSIITNVEEDHLDYFSGLNHIISSFQKFASLTSPYGCIIVCSDDKNVCQVVQNADRKVSRSDGLDDKKADYTAENITERRQWLSRHGLTVYRRGGDKMVEINPERSRHGIMCSTRLP